MNWSQAPECKHLTTTMTTSDAGLGLAAICKAGTLLPPLSKDEGGTLTSGITLLVHSVREPPHIL